MSINDWCWNRIILSIYEREREREDRLCTIELHSPNRTESHWISFTVVLKKIQKYERSSQGNSTETVLPAALLRPLRLPRLTEVILSTITQSYRVTNSSLYYRDRFYVLGYLRPSNFNLYHRVPGTCFTCSRNGRRTFSWHDRPSSRLPLEK